MAVLEGRNLTKTYRQGQILKLIRGKRIHTQDELAQELKNQGIAATQVTLSRDIRDLRLVKTRDGYQEVAPEETGPAFTLLAAEFLKDVLRAQNLVVLKTAAILLCMRTGAPGGLFTPSLTFGAMLGGVLGYAWSWIWPGVPAGLFALLGAGAMLAATTQGPISSVVLLMELTGRDRSFVLPLLVVVCAATLVARTIETRSIYDARLTDEQLVERQKLRDRPLQ